MAVGLIVGGAELEGVCLAAALARDAGAGTLLLADHCLHLQLAELEVGAQTEEAADAWHQAHIAGERHVASLDEFHNFVFLSVVLQLHVLLVEVKGSLGVIVQVQINLVAHLAVHREIDFLVEVKAERLSAAGGQSWVVHPLHVGTHFQFGTSLSLQLHAARSENLLGRTQVEVHVGEVELVLSFVLECLAVSHAVVALHALLEAPCLVFLGRHQYGGVKIACGHAQCHSALSWYASAHAHGGRALLAALTAPVVLSAPTVLGVAIIWSALIIPIPGAALATGCSLRSLRGGASQRGAYGVGVVSLVIGYRG